jgi:hypothetical protein
MDELQSDDLPEVPGVTMEDRERFHRDVVAWQHARWWRARRKAARALLETISELQEHALAADDARVRGERTDDAPAASADAPKTRAPH